MKHIFYRTFVFSALAVCAFGFSSNQVHAYVTTGQKVVTLDNGASLFLIEYRFGTGNHEVQMPIQTTNSEIKATNTLSYTIIDEDDQKIDGTATGIVLSGARILENTMYSIPKSFAKKFVLAVVFIPQEGTAADDYRLQVTHLPFNFDGAQQLQLNPSELQYYTTPYTDL